MKTILKGRILTIPNLLSLIRILLIPLFVWFYLRKNNIPATVITLLASALTDALDGVIARRFNMISDFGKALDPFADKLTQFAMLCCLLIRFPHMIWNYSVFLRRFPYKSYSIISFIHQRTQSHKRLRCFHPAGLPLLHRSGFLMLPAWYNLQT